MTLGIMQPYFLPYIGYWQLLAAVDRFVVYDNIQYTKKGWINRNRFLRDGQEATFTVPLKKGSDVLHVAQRVIADDFDPQSLLNRLSAAYRRAPYFGPVLPLVETIVTNSSRNLFEYLHHAIVTTAAYLDIQTPIVISSQVSIDHGLRSERKVIAFCQALGADRYVNAIGGRSLYSADSFATSGVELNFLQSSLTEYPQFDHPFVPALSIVDVMMFNSRDAIRRMLGDYELVRC